MKEQTLVDLLQSVSLILLIVFVGIEKVKNK